MRDVAAAISDGVEPGNEAFLPRSVTGEEWDDTICAILTPGTRRIVRTVTAWGMELTKLKISFA